jgi:hypothetical protein
MVDPTVRLGSVGVIDGMVGEDLDDASITFNARTFRDDSHVSCSGGPATIRTAVAELRPTEETVTLNVWHWNRYGPGAGNGECYTVTVPIWDWYPAITG